VLDSIEKVPVDAKYRPLQSVIIERVTIHANPIAQDES
jgi:peptidyl-prolyl cis-trans isomerase-like 3